MKWLFIFLFSALQITAFAQKKNYNVIAYYTGDDKTLSRYPLEKLTHIIYSFLALKNDTLGFRNAQQEENLKKIAELKNQYPRLKIMVSIGGWGGCAPCSDLFASEQSRKIFAKTTVELFKKYNVDGIDLDWEYPAIKGYPGHKFMPEDKNNFTELIKELRNEMGGRYILSFAAGGFTKFLEESVDWKSIMPLLDFVNLMTYDLVSGYSKMTGHHTALYSRKEQTQSTDNCVSWLLRHGLPAEKLIVGAAFYARVWEQVPDIKNGLYQPGIFKLSLSYRKFDSYFTDTAGFKLYYDKKAKAPYYYSPAKKLFGTFDSPESIRQKCKYVRRRKLGGIMFWQLSEDKPENGLLEVIGKKLKN